MRRLFFVLACSCVVTIVAAAAVARPGVQPSGLPPLAPEKINPNIHKIKHVIIITQENRSFDEYFGTYPKADGFPSPLPCIPDPTTGGCDRPYLNHSDSPSGGPHFAKDAVADIDGGKMDGFVAEAARAGSTNPSQVMGYQDGTDLPTYWSLAQNYVLNDHFFESVAAWSLVSHVALFSAWAAHCKGGDPLLCQPGRAITQSTNHPTPYAWTDITYLFYKNNVTWACYLDTPNYSSGLGQVSPGFEDVTSGLWNVLPGFEDVTEDGQLANLQKLSNYFSAAQNGTLPAVSWIIPKFNDSEHPPASLSTGQTYVSSIIDAAMMGPEWSSTAIFVWWDDWGGFYDHVVPPTIDGLGLGLRVPALLVSPYAKAGHIDHQILSSDSYIKFIEDDFVGGQRLDPSTDGRPDSRPGVRENWNGYGDLVNDFDFTLHPRAPHLLPLHPITMLRAGPRTSTFVIRHLR